MTGEKALDKRGIYLARGVLALSAAVLALWLALGCGGVAARSQPPVRVYGETDP